MAIFSGNYFGKFMLLAATVLWASCSDVDKNANKSSAVDDKSDATSYEKQKVLDNLKELQNETPNSNNLSIPIYRFIHTQFSANGVEIKVSRAVLIDDSVYNNDVEKIADILRKKSNALFETYDSFYKKDVHEQWDHLFLTLDIFINKNGFVDKIEFNKVDNKISKGFEKKIAEHLMPTRFKDVGKNIVSLSFDFYHDRLAGILDGSPAELITRANSSVNAPTVDELKISNGIIYDKASILKVIRQRTPGLRHIYNKHLNRNRAISCQKNNQDDVDPDFSGTIIFQLNIGLDGFVLKIEIQSSNTGNKDFDDDIKIALSRWYFPKLKSSDIVTFPITFFKNVSEYRITTPYKKSNYPEIRM
ncbi:AgmX/PglI C-terminal domain-containing protein [Fibrobacter sp.]|uniref:AgmX/PglI C-terminal domain-containing protein n=1 Tax=Fibrobacter sp. TaxID=35828 RepID=UPI0038661593